MTYLSGCVAGEAKQTIAGFAITDKNYPEALKALMDRYYDEEAIIAAHYSRLHNLAACKHKSSEMRTMYDAIANHLRSLEALKETTDNMQMVTLIQSKFPNELKAHLELHKEDGKKWTVEMVLEMINKYVKSKEAADIKKTTLDNQTEEHSTCEALYATSQPRRGPQNDRKYNNYQGYRNSQQQQHQHSQHQRQQQRNPNNNQRSPRCAFCQTQTHWSSDC